MRIVDLLKKAFIGGDWVVGYREIGKGKYTIIPLNVGWIADPFLLEYQGEHYLFVEYVSGKKGEIAYYKFINNIPVFQKVIISEPYHLSYPCVFMHGDDVYMIPESADNHSIDLYKAVIFPDKWERLSELNKGIFYDTTYLCYRGIHFIICYSPKKGRYGLEIFTLDLENKKISILSKKHFSENVGRPAGNLIEDHGELVRPAQDCSRKYGERLLFYTVKTISSGEYIEELRDVLSVEDVDDRFQRIHTYNRDSKYEVVDFFKEKFHLLRPVRLIMKILKQRF